MASLDKLAAELEEKLKKAAEATNALMLQMIEDRASLGQVVGAKKTEAEVKADLEARAAQKEAKKCCRRSMAFTPSKSSSGSGEVDGACSPALRRPLRRRAITSRRREVRCRRRRREMGTENMTA